MSIILSADIPQDVPFAPVAPVTMPSAWTYTIPDTLAAGSPPADLAEFEFAARPGQVGSLAVNVGVPAGRSAVAVAPYMEADTDDATERWSFPQVAATEAGVPMDFDFPEFPAGTTKARLGFELREPAAGRILRTNLYTDPRSTSATPWGSRNSWPVAASANAVFTGLPVNIATQVATTCNSAATGTNRGMDFYQSPSAATPTAGMGYPVTAGQTVTLSMYVKPTKAGTMQFTARCFTGSTWSAVAVAGTGVAATANVWTRISVTFTVPAGATHVCGLVLNTTSVAWAVGDTIAVTGVQLKEGATPGAYFDGETDDDTNVGYHWQGTANASVSEAYDTGAVTTVYRTNLCPNPSFETDTTGWFAWWSSWAGSGTDFPTFATTRQTSGGAVSSGYCQNVMSSVGSYTVADFFIRASSRVLLEEGQTYTVSAWVRGSAGSTVAVHTDFRTASTGGSLYGTPGQGSATRTGEWQWISKTFTAPVGYPYLDLRVGTYGAPPVGLPAGTVLDVDGVLIEKSSTVGSYFDGSYDTVPDYSARWTGTAHASTSELYAGGTPTTEPGRSLRVSGLTMATQASAGEIVGANLTRPLRRSVFDALNEEAPQIAVGTPGLLAGSITYLCDTFEEALTLDSIYQFAGQITLTTGTGVALDGFRHMAVDQLRLDAERALPGRPAKWLVRAEVRETKA